MKDGAIVTEDDRARGPATGVDRDPLLGRELTLAPPATTVLSRLNEELGGNWEFRSPEFLIRGGRAHVLAWELFSPRAPAGRRGRHSLCAFKSFPI